MQKKKSYRKSSPKGNGRSRSKPLEENVVVKCLDLDEYGRGLIEYRGAELAVEKLLPQETAIVDVYQTSKKRYAEIKHLESVSPQRTKPPCPYYEQCGGCQLQHLSYEGQNKFKANIVHKYLGSFGTVLPLIPMENPLYYRNKIHSTYGTDRAGKTISGIYQSFSHRIIPIDQCLIQDQKADEILLTIRELAIRYKLQPFYEDRSIGFLRHILIRVSKDGKVMVVLVTANRAFPGGKKFVRELVNKYPEIVTVVQNINAQQTSMVLGDQQFTLYGPGYLTDHLAGLDFQIDPQSFYQVNVKQTEKLYRAALKFAELKGTETVIDAYSGIGTISLLIAQKADFVYGIEVNRAAIRNSIRNARLNKIKNVRFIQSDAGDFMSEFAEEKAHVDVVFMDPPRNGADQQFLDSLLKLAPQKVVYISCNPVTQARDLKHLVANGYKVAKIQPVDMFPHTYHVETIVALYKKD